MKIFTWLAGAVVFCIGLLNLVLIHPVPGIVFLLLSLVYFPATDTLLRQRFNRSIPPVVKIMLAVIIVWFTLGVSDLGDRFD